MFALWNEDYARKEKVSGSWNNDSMHEGDEEAIQKAVIESWEQDVEKGTTVGDMFAINYTFMIEGANYGANCITFGYLTGKFIAENE